MRHDNCRMMKGAFAVVESRGKACLIGGFLGLLPLLSAFAQVQVPGSFPLEAQTAQQLMEQLRKDRSVGSMHVLKIASLIKQSARVTPLSGVLDEAIRKPVAEAVVTHPQWSAALTGIDYAQASADESRAALRPQISGGLDSGLRSYGSNPITGSRSTSYSSTSAQIAVKQLLFDGESKINSWKSAQKKVDAQTARSYIQRSELIYGLLEASMNKQRFEIQKFWVNNFEDQRKETARKILRRFEMGSGTIYDIARSDMKVNDSRVNLQQIGIQLNNAKAVLQEFKLPEDLSMPSLGQRIELTPEELEQQMIEHPLMIEAQAFLEASTLDVAAVKASQKPVVQVELSRTDRAYGAFVSRSADYSTLITLTHNFYSGGAETARMAQAAARLMQARSEMESKQKGLKTTLLRAVNEANNLHSALELRKVGVDASVASFTATTKLFEVSRGSLQDLQRAEDDLYENMKQLIDNWFDVSIAYYRYLHVTNQLMNQFFRLPVEIQDKPKPAS
jgi:adhesin transport system outer membrane protein